MSKYRWLYYPLLIFTISRLFIFGAGIVGDLMMPTEEKHWVADPDSPFLSQWAKWDSQYYFDIATNGYWFRPEQQSNVAFFPLYPMLMMVLGKFLDNNVILSGFLVSNAAFFGVLVFLYLLTELEVDSAAAGRAVLYLAVFPTSFFFSSVYTESLFLMLSLASMYFARRHLWFPAALLGMLCAATRNIGVLMWALVMWEWLRVQGWNLWKLHKKEMWASLWGGIGQHWADMFIIAIIPLGLLAYMFFLKQNFDRPLAFIETQAAWGRENIGPVEVIKKNISYILAGELNKGRITSIWNLTALLGFLALTPFIWWKLGEGYAIYVLIQMLVPSASATGSIIRYVLTSFPAFILLGDWGRRDWVDRTILSLFVIFLGVFVTIFVNWIFVA
jgi:hypothetical protein